MRVNTLSSTFEDYIFIIDPLQERSVVTGFVKPHRTEDLDPGLPKTDVCGSDHIALCAELVWEAKDLAAT